MYVVYQLKDHCDRVVDLSAQSLLQTKCAYGTTEAVNSALMLLSLV